MIGNDIVDLTCVNSIWKSPRFLVKIFTKKELQIISISKNKLQTVWLLWSMKEAAYKIYIQQFGKRFFNPKKLVCYITSSNTGGVTIENKTYTTLSTLSKEYIYTIATLKNSVKYKSAVFQFENTSYATQSESLKDYFIKHLSENFDLNSQDLQIQKNSFGVPEVYHNNAKLPFQLSLTHCGNYGGYVYF